MSVPDIADVPVSRIMTDWPQTIQVFLNARLLCVGCPIGGFHTIADAAREHGIDAQSLEEKVLESIAAEPAAAVNRQPTGCRRP